jgi:hypothetical protein
MKLCYETAGYRKSITPCPYGNVSECSGIPVMVGSGACCDCKSCGPYDGQEHWVDCSKHNEELKCQCLVESIGAIDNYCDCNRPAKYKAPKGKPWNERPVCGIHRNMIDNQSERFKTTKCEAL